MPCPPLLRHRQRHLRRLFGTNLRVEELQDGAAWDQARAERVVRSAAGVAPIDAVVVLAKVRVTNQ